MSLIVHHLIRQLYIIFTRCLIRNGHAPAKRCLCYALYNKMEVYFCPVRSCSMLAAMTLINGSSTVLPVVRGVM